MKTKHLLLLIAILFALVACNSNEPANNTNNSSESTIEQLLIGSWYIAEEEDGDIYEYGEDVYTFHENGICENDVKDGNYSYHYKGSWVLTDNLLTIRTSDGKREEGVVEKYTIRSITDKEMIWLDKNEDDFMYIVKRYK